MRIRRVVIGDDADGRTTVIADELCDPTTVGLRPGFEFHRLWQLDGAATLPVIAAQGQPTGSVFPPPGGVRFGLMTVPPDGQANSISPTADAIAEMDHKMPGVRSTFVGTEPGMHRTDTVDFMGVLEGHGGLRTDNGLVVRLGAGDCLVQHGTAHTWFNDGSVPMRLWFAVLGAHPRAEPQC